MSVPPPTFPEGGRSPGARVTLVGRAIHYRPASFCLSRASTTAASQAFEPRGWHRFVLLSVARANAGDRAGSDANLSVLARMVVDDLGGTPEVIRKVRQWCLLAERSLDRV